MKKFKKGFTLAEVLITLSIIGIISAIVMPSVISSYQYKAIGVRLSKFAATTEQATRAYVVQNDTFPTIPGTSNANMGPVVDFINEAFLFTGVSNGTSNQGSYTVSGIGTLEATNTGIPATMNTKVAAGTNQFVGTLKDGTEVAFSTYTDNSVPAENAENVAVTGLRNAIGDGSKTGMPSFNISFMPNSNGLPDAVQKTYNFTVTELGYVFPSANDSCLWNIYNAGWTTNSATFRGDGNACLTAAGGTSSSTSTSTSTSTSSGG